MEEEEIEEVETESSETKVEALLSRLSFELLIVDPFSPPPLRRSKVSEEGSPPPLETAAIRASRLATFFVRCGNEETGSALDVVCW